MTPHQALKRYFGYSQFRYNQLEIIESILAKNDTLAILPTGGGKSVCYQIPGLLLKGTTIVVSPLISLMKDQVDRLNSRGILSTYINSSLSKTEIANRMTIMRLGRWRFVYVAPERLATKSFISACQRLKIPLIAVDEAHCISQWGHEFRPEYLRIARFSSQLKRQPVILALTATATPAVKDDIIGQLKLLSPCIFTNSFRRSNLKLHTISCAKPSHKLFYLTYLLVKHPNEASIIYTQTRERAEELQALLSTWLPQLKAGVYHGGLTTEQRSHVQEEFLDHKLNTIFATNAFGMGVDKSDIRLVINYDFPSSIEEYYQEIGRAGRDGQPAECYWLYYEEDSVLAAEITLGAGVRDQTYLQHLLHQLQAVERFGQTPTCRTQQVLAYFGENTDQGCGHCDICQPHSFLADQDTKTQFTRLQSLVKTLARAHHLPSNLIASPDLQHWLLLLKPRTKTAFLALPGIGQGWVKRWQPSFASFFTQLEADL